MDPTPTRPEPPTRPCGVRKARGLDGGRLFVADTQNSRVLIYNSIPASSGATPDVVVGQPDFDTRPEPDLTQLQRKCLGHRHARPGLGHREQRQDVRD